MARLVPWLEGAGRELQREGWSRLQRLSWLESQLDIYRGLPSKIEQYFPSIQSFFNHSLSLQSSIARVGLSRKIKDGALSLALDLRYWSSLTFSIFSRSFWEMSSHTMLGMRVCGCRAGFSAGYSFAARFSRRRVTASSANC